jgi:hypothetical protein
MEKIELLQVAWSELAIHTERFEAQLRESHQEEEQQHQKLQEKMERVVLEGNNARETLHKKTVECTKIFWEVSYWMGIISRCNQTLEDLCMKIHSLNEEVSIAMDLLEQQGKIRSDPTSRQ